jgi:glycosyltransferase involved in cell wall biosynthesis
MLILKRVLNRYMQITVVIPTYNRKAALLSLLNNLNQSISPTNEVIIVDSGNDNLKSIDYSAFENLKVIYLRSESSVCIQRNTGIRFASSEWIFICDDDIEVPNDYLSMLITHIKYHPEAGAVSGSVLQHEENKWTSSYNLSSAKDLLLRYVFKLSIWGKIDVKQNNFIIKKIKNYYSAKGNHISKSGWPVITDFSGDFFITPVYGLGAALIKKSWLELSPYDEILDKHGIGDNYGVSIGFPEIGVHVLNDAFVFHHQETANRLQKPLQYYRRILALDYFIKTKKNIGHVKWRWLLWSLFGNLVISIVKQDKIMIRPAYKSLVMVLFGQNPYCKNAATVIEPLL